MGQDKQTIPARHGTATFVPAGSTIKIINTSGTQVIDTWAFALPSPPTKEEAKGETNGTKEAEKPAPKKPKAKKGDFPSQEEAEAATAKGMEPEEAAKSGWSSYIPSVNLLGSKSEGEKKEVKENSKGWSQYFSAGQGFSSYIPTKDSLSSFASSHYRDPNKPYIQQLSDFSKTPVGAAGMSALSGSGYASSFYAGYSAWTGGGGDAQPPMEYLSMSHTRASTKHLVPKKGDTLVSNLREPMLTVVEDSTGVHDTMIAACDPQRYRELGVDKWVEHGSCAENLVMALKELNERAGLKGPKGIGAEVTMNSVPQPLNLFMNIPWTDSGDLSFDKPAGKKGDHIRLRAERDVVVVMSACPQDVLDINGKKSEDAHFIVEEELDPSSEDIRKRLESAGKTEKPPRKTGVRKLERAPKKTPAAAPAAEKAESSSPAPAKATPKPAPKAAPKATPKPAATKKHTALGQKKTPKPSASSSTAGPPRSAPAKSRPTPVRHDSASTVPSNTKHAGPAASETTASTRSGASQATQSTAGGAEKKKPRKIPRKTA